MTRTGDREIVVVSGILPDNSGELACMNKVRECFCCFVLFCYETVMYWGFT